MNNQNQIKSLLDSKEVINIQKIKIEGRWEEYRNASYNIKLWFKFWKKIFKNDKNSKILDFGSGACWGGFVANKLNLNNHFNLDIDIKEVKEIFGTYADCLGQSVTYYDGKVIPFESDFFDVVVAKASIMKLDRTDISNVINELVRVSKVNANWYVASKGMCYRLKESIAIHELSEVLSEKNISIKCWTWSPFECIRSKSPWTEFYLLYILHKYIRKIKLMFI
jgi:hypothetical protein